MLKNVKADQVLTANVANANESYSWEHPKVAPNALFTEVDSVKNIRYHHDEGDFIDFNVQKLIPHKLSEYGPALAVADVDGNGLDDIITAGNSALHSQLFLQQADGKFIRRDLFPDQKGKFTETKDEGMLLFDANGDGKPDLYIASGGYKSVPGSPNYQDHLYINDGKGNFTLAANALPTDHASKLCVRAVDYNKDGKLDLFVSGRVDPWNYPRPVSSCILRNDSHNGAVKFTNVTSEVAPALTNIGMVCDGLFTDFDGDGWPDLVMAGEWMPVTFLKNDHGKFVNVTSKTGVGTQLGMWNSIVAGDFRHTGRMDYIVGNLGENSLLQASDEYPIYITAKDFDQSGTYSAIPSIFLPDQNGDKKEFPMHGRDDMLKQMISMKKKYTNYKSYATATMDDILSPEQRKGALRLKANMLKSCYLRNDGNGKFTIIPLPAEAQFSTLNGMVTGDFDGDGNLDVAINGNDYGTDVSIGRYDAFNGLILKGDGRGGFKPMTIAQSGIYIPGNGKALVKLRDNKGNLLLAASQDKGFMKVYQLNFRSNTISPVATDSYALITYKNGKTEKQEFYYGSSFLSQSARFVKLNDQMVSITFFDDKNTGRTVKVN